MLFRSFGSGAPPINNGRLPFWWDMLTVAVFSLVIYYWALHDRLPKQEMELLVAKQSVRMGDVPAQPRH